MSRWKFLQQFLHCFIYVFLVFQRILAGADRLRREACPNQLLCGRVIKIQYEGSNVNICAGCRRGAHGSVQAGRTEEIAHAGGIPLLLPVDSDAVANQKIGPVGVYLCQALRDELGID